MPQLGVLGRTDREAWACMQRQRQLEPEVVRQPGAAEGRESQKGKNQKVTGSNMY